MAVRRLQAGSTGPVQDVQLFPQEGRPAGPRRPGACRGTRRTGGCARGGAGPGTPRMDVAPVGRAAAHRKQHRAGVHRRAHRRRAVRGPRVGPADGRQWRARHAVPARRPEAPGAPGRHQRSGSSEGVAGRGPGRPAGAAGASARTPARRRHRRDGGRRQRRRKDHDDRQADQASGRGWAKSAVGRSRHVPRRGARATCGVGRPQPGADRQPGGRRPGSGGVRCRRGWPLTRLRCGHRRHGGPPADAAPSDGRAAQDQAHHRQGDGRGAP